MSISQSTLTRANQYFIMFVYQTIYDKYFTNNLLQYFFVVDLKQLSNKLQDMFSNDNTSSKWDQYIYFIGYK